MGGRSSSSSSSSTSQTSSITQGDTTLNDYSNFFGSSVLNTGNFNPNNAKSANPYAQSTPYMNSTTTQRNDSSATGATATLPLMAGGGGGAVGTGGELWQDLASIAGSALTGAGNSNNANGYKTSYVSTPTQAPATFTNATNSNNIFPLVLIAGAGLVAFMIIK